jgi:hypothetical protein
MMRDFMKAEELFIYIYIFLYIYRNFFLKRHADMKPYYDYNIVSLVLYVYANARMLKIVLIK